MAKLYHNSKNIEDVRALIRNTSEENKDKAIKYLQNLTKICKLYYAN